jgi:hypothetical protein
LKGGAKVRFSEEVEMRGRGAGDESFGIIYSQFPLGIKLTPSAIFLSIDGNGFHEFYVTFV